MRLPFAIAFLTLTATGLCATACTSTMPQPDAKTASKSSAAEPSDEFVVIALQHAPADEVAAVVNRSLDSRTVRIQPDARTNSLVVVGPASELARIKLLIAELDIEVK